MKEWRYMAACLYEISKYSEALEPCDKGLKLNSTDALCLSVKAKCLSQLGKYEEAIEYYNKYSMIELSASTLRAKAFCLIRIKKYDAALDVIDSALTLAPKNLNTLYS
jgi:tetratricopeptide (TPR) repeat protein